MSRRGPNGARHIGGLGASVVVLCVLSGCEPELPPFRVAHGDCELYTDVPVTFSDALPREHCAFGDRLSASLGLPLEAVPLRYGLYEERATVEALCSPADAPRAACAFPGLVRSTAPIHQHELVHTTLVGRDLLGTLALQEGAAAVFGCGRTSPDEIAPNLSLELLVDSNAFHALGDYDGAMAFVSFLLDLEGEATFAQLLAQVSYHSGLEALNAALLDLYGSDAAALITRCAELGPQPTYRLCRRVYECAAPEWSGDRALELERGISSGTAFGGAIRTLTVEREATLRIDADLVGGEVRVISCDRRPDVVPDAGFWSTRSDTAAIAPGRYAVWVTARVPEPDQSSVEAEVSITIE